MIVGVPGTGIGGIFYLASALLVPVRRLIGRSSVTHGVSVAVLAVGVLVGTGVTGWFLGLLIGPTAVNASVGRLAAASALGHHYQSVVRWASLFAAAVTLALVLLSVEVARIIVRRPAAVPRPR
jgi:hypothetical protein